MSTAKFNTWLNPSGTENYKCRAWVNFNGTGTVAIRASGGVSSISDNGTGDYTVNFTTAMPDANYTCISTGSDSATPSGGSRSFHHARTLATGSVRVNSADVNGNLVDGVLAFVAIFR
jgi:hypothetical protein